MRGFHGHVSTRSADEMEVLPASKIDHKRNRRRVNMDFAGKYAVMDNGIPECVYFEVQRHPILAMNTCEFDRFRICKAR
jgi:hypothetical protein